MPVDDHDGEGSLVAPDAGGPGLAWRDVFGPVLGAAANVVPFLIPFAMAWGIKDSAEYRKRMSEIEDRIRNLRATDGDLDRRLRALEEAASRHHGLPAEFKKRDIRMAFTAVAEGAAADEAEVLDACTNFAANAFAGRTGSQVAIAALDSLPLVTADALSFLRGLPARPMGAREAATRAGGQDVLEALAALGLIGFQNPSGSTNLGSNRIFLTSVGRELARLTGPGDRTTTLS